MSNQDSAAPTSPPCPDCFRSDGTHPDGCVNEEVTMPMRGAAPTSTPTYAESVASALEEFREKYEAGFAPDSELIADAVVLLRRRGAAPTSTPREQTRAERGECPDCQAFKPSRPLEHREGCSMMDWTPSGTTGPSDAPKPTYGNGLCACGHLSNDHSCDRDTCDDRCSQCDCEAFRCVRVAGPADSGSHDRTRIKEWSKAQCPWCSEAPTVRFCEGCQIRVGWVQKYLAHVAAPPPTPCACGHFATDHACGYETSDGPCRCQGFRRETPVTESVRPSPTSTPLDVQREELIAQLRSNQQHERHRNYAETVYWCRQWRLLAEALAASPASALVADKGQK